VRLTKFEWLNGMHLHRIEFVRAVFVQVVSSEDAGRAEALHEITACISVRKINTLNCFIRNKLKINNFDVLQK
jgi:hypothetical protein